MTNTTRSFSEAVNKQYGTIVKRVLSICLILLLSSCLKEGMSYEVYESRKESPRTPKMTSSNDNGVTTQKNLTLKWITPKNWSEKEANSFRVGSFEFPSIKGREAELSIILLSGNGGGIAANINRWRDQLSLSSLNEANILENLKEVQGKLGLYKYEQISNGEESILVAFIEFKKTTIFIKATGHYEVIDSQETAFIKFIKGIYEDQ